VRGAEAPRAQPAALELGHAARLTFYRDPSALLARLTGHYIIEFERAELRLD
jgi:hypothetical protein